MKVILETCHVHSIIYLLFYFNIKYIETSEMMYYTLMACMFVIKYYIQQYKRDSKNIIT